MGYRVVRLLVMVWKLPARRMRRRLVYGIKFGGVVFHHALRGSCREGGVALLEIFFTVASST